MTIEAGVVVGLDGAPIYWHVPAGRTGGSLPDSQELWDVFWEHKDNLAGFAHTHPGSGVPGPSWTDVTTFAAVESGLADRLVWWIASSDELVKVTWCGPGKHDYRVELAPDQPGWLAELRRLSGVT